MKKIIQFILVVFIFIQNNKVNAQLFVSPNSYVFNKGSLLFVKGTIELNATTSDLYLRNEGQLIQGTSTTSTNKGVGKLSVFQEGTVSNYAYNYWCSPIGNASASIGNENFGISMLNRPTSATASTPATTVAMTGYNGISNPLQIEPYWIWKFLSSSTYSQWFQSNALSNINAGEGFTMKGTAGIDAVNPGEITSNNPGSNQRYDFRGKPNDGDIAINVSNTKLTLTGNPYPSAIDLSAFLTDATNSTGVAYFWEHDKSVTSHVLVNYRGGYGTYSPISRGGTGIYVPAKFYAYDINGNPLAITSSPNNSYARYFSPIGQGFMIEGNALGTTVFMKNIYRVFQKENVSTSVFEKHSKLAFDVASNFLPQIQSVSGFDYTTVSKLDVPQIRFNALLNNEAIKQVVLAFDANATDGIDHAKDAKNPSDNTPIDMYFVLENNEFIISVIQFNQDKRIPVGFKSSAISTVKLMVSDMLNFTQANEVFLYDKQTGIYHDIKNDSYEFTINSGITNDRYEITFKDSSLAINEMGDFEIDIFQNNRNQVLNVYNPNLVHLESISLYDITGKLIVNSQNVETKNSYQFETTVFAEGVYFVKVKSNTGQINTQKIIIAKGK